LLVPKELIEKAKDKMGDKAAYLIVEALQLENFDEKNLKASCPFHKEKTPSFVYNPKHNHWHCFGCNRNFGILDLYMQQGYTYLGAVEKLFEETDIKFKFGERNVKTKREYKYPKHEDNTDRTTVEKYLSLRNISNDILDYCDITEDKYHNIVFHYYDSNDVLTMVKYRPARRLEKGEIKAWCQKDADTTPLLFNMNRIDPSQPLLICEGEIDCLSAIESGFKNSVSVPLGAGNLHWIEENWDWLEQFTKIIIWADADEAGRKMKKNVIPRLGEWRCYEVEAPTEIEIDDKTKYIKDINEVLYYLGKAKVLECINNAKEIPITDVVDLYDVQEFDMENSEGVYSGFKTLDQWIYKFFFGCLNTITGLNGGGKSVLINQMCVCEPLNQGYDVFIFSGEMTKPQLKNWIELNLAGRRHIVVENKHIRKINSNSFNYF
jgi:twinkle protein